MFIKLKQKIKILSKKISGFGILKFPSRKVLLGVFLMVMIFGGIGNVKAAEPLENAPIGQCRSNQGDCENLITDFCERSSKEISSGWLSWLIDVQLKTIKYNPITWLAGGFSPDSTEDAASDICESALKCANQGTSESPNWCVTATNESEFVGEMTGKSIENAAKNPFTAAGAWVLERIANIILAVIYLICWLLLQLVGVFVDVAAWILSSALDSGLYQNMFKSDMVSEGWTIVRDVCNMFFILILLVISLATILRIQTYKAQSLLLPLLIAAFLVNFSRPIVELAIDASQILMYQFVNLFTTNGGSTSDIGNLVTVKKNILDVFWNGGQIIHDIIFGSWTKMVGNVIAIMFGLIFLIVLCLVYLAMAMFLIIRLVALTILIILSPIGFFFNILPQTKSYASKYWSELSKYIIFGPIFAFFIYLSSSLAINIADPTINVYSGAADSTGKGLSETLTQISVMFNGQLLQYIIVLVFLYASIWIARQLGIWGADKVEGMTIGKLAALGGAAGGFIGGAAGGLTSRWLAKGGRIPGVGKVSDWTSKKLQGKEGSGKMAKLSRWTGRRVEGAAEKKQKMASMMSPEVWKKAYGNYVSDEEAEAYGESSARLQDLMNRATGKGKTNNAELARLARIAEEQRKILSKNPKVIGKYVADAVNRGDGIRAEAGMREAAAGGDTDSVLEALGYKNTDKDYDTMMEKEIEPLLGKRQTAILDSDIAQMEKADGNYSMWGRSGYDSKNDEWKRNSEDDWQKASAKKFSTTAGKQKWQNFDARTLMDEVAPNKFKLKETGKLIVQNELTDVDMQWIRESKTAELKKVKQDEGEIRKLGPWGVKLMKEIDQKLGTGTQGQGKNTQTSQTPKNPTTETPPETKETKKAYA